MRKRQLLNRLNNSRRAHTWVTVLGIIFIILCVLGVEHWYIERNKPEEVSYNEFLSDLHRHKIDTVYYNPNDEYMRYTLFNADTKDLSKKEREEYTYEKEDWRMVLYPASTGFREMLLKYDTNTVIKSFEARSKTIISVLVSIAVPVAIFVIIWGRLMRGKNEPITTETGIKTKFDDVVGQDEIIDDLRFIVALMRGTYRNDAFKMDIPKGMLFSGMPGTGKTLLARAIAGESGVPFIYLNASACIELFAGIGAKRIRNIFNTAKKLAPCIVFIDEIDAIGKSRNSAMQNSEDVQTLNALLQEMDGFNGNTGVFVIGATNNADKLDKALLRSGRFDRQVIIAPPRDWKVRKQLFELYLKGVSHSIDLDTVSKQCVGFTGADIHTIVNEAKLIASMNEVTVLTTEHIEEAIDKRIFKGNHSKRDEKTEEDKTIAYHEAGHAVMAYLLDEPIARVTIVGSTTGVGGFMMQQDSEKKLLTDEDLRHQVMIAYGGRASEDIKFKGRVSIGAVSDITQATGILESYVKRYGFDSERYGLIDMSALTDQKLIENSNVVERISELSKELYNKARTLLSANYSLVEMLAEKLLKEETISGAAVVDMFKYVEIHC